MSNFKLKSFLFSIIVLTGMLLSACNGSGGGSTSTPTPSPSPSPSPTPSSTPTATPRGVSVLSVTPLLGSASMESDGATYALISRSGSLSNPVTIELQSNNPSKMSIDQTSVTLGVNESATYVKLNGITIGSAELTATANGYIESSVGFSITPAPLFSCIADISNPKSPTLCGCLKENDGSGLTWYRDGHQSAIWTNWCSGSGRALDLNCSSSNGESINAFNTKNHCGYSDWHLPTITSSVTNNEFVESSGGNWGTIGTYAINSGSYRSGGDLSSWLNANGFNGGVIGNAYWSNVSDGFNQSWSMIMGTSKVTFASNIAPFINVLLVHTPTLSVTPLLGSASMESDGATYALISRSGNLSNPVTVAVQSNSPSMSVDKTSVTLSANEDHTYVKLNGVTIGSAELTATASGYIESSVGFSITSAPLFSCVADISNSASPTLCGCLKENDGSGLTWYRDGSQSGLWGNWCSGSGVVVDLVCKALNPSTQGNNGESLNAFNKKSYCGYSDWHLPTIIDPNKLYIESVGGNWGTIGTYAINNGYPTKTDLSIWFNANNFINITNNAYYWASGSYDNTTMWAPNLKFDLLMSGNVNYSKNLLVVRGSQ